jgi:uncharacterized protein YihD (DUF1040 family)
MRDPERINRIIERIRAIWLTQPDTRLTQLIMNALNMNSDPYYVEDDLLEERLKQYEETLKLME